jgi:hypothetical protein
MPEYITLDVGMITRLALRFYSNKALLALLNQPPYSAAHVDLLPRMSLSWREDFDFECATIQATGLLPAHGCASSALVTFSEKEDSRETSISPNMYEYHQGFPIVYDCGIVNVPISSKRGNE